MQRVMYYYNADAFAVSYSIARVKDGNIWSTDTESYDTASTVAWADAIVTATAVTALGAWDITIPFLSDFDSMGVYQVAVYADPGASAVTPIMGIVVYVQITGEVTILDIK